MLNILHMNSYTAPFRASQTYCFALLFYAAREQTSYVVKITWYLNLKTLRIVNQQVNVSGIFPLKKWIFYAIRQNQTKRGCLNDR